MDKSVRANSFPESNIQRFYMIGHTITNATTSKIKKFTNYVTQD